MLRSLRKKKANKSDKTYIPGAFSDKVTTDIDFTDEPVVHCDAPVLTITFIDDSDVPITRTFPCEY